MTRAGFLVLVAPDGTVRGSVGFRPIDNARLTAGGGAVAWMANDAAHHWGAEHKVWSDMPFPSGAVDNLIPAGDRILAAINLGSSDRVGYRSGLLLFDGQTMRAWDHRGKLTSGVGTDGSAVVGFSAPGLMDHVVQLTILTDGAQPEAFGPRIGSSLAWGENMVQANGRTCTLVAMATTGQAGQIWRIDVGARKVDVVAIQGEAGLVDGWYTGAGPSQLTAIDGQLYWLSNGSLWTADPLSGASRHVLKTESGGWFLTASGLVHVTYVDRQWKLDHHNPVDGTRVESVGPFKVDGSSGMSVDGALVVPL